MASILVVDDARSTLRALEVVLKREGYTVLTAASGAEALTQLEHHEVELLLCDVRMPKMDGLTVLRQVKVQDAGIAVVMMSGQGQTVRDITLLLQVSEDYVRDVIHAFNERGFDALDPKPSGGRPKRIGEQLRNWICTIARTSPPTGA